MSTTGNWGDKVIITLPSDGIRRHKNWCINHRKPDNFCSVLCGKCIGSAFCENYKTEIAEEKPVFQEMADAGKQVPCINLQPVKPKEFPMTEYYKLATVSDKLMGKTVLVRNTPHTFRIATVTEEDFYYFSVYYNGATHKYLKRAAMKSKSVYILVESKKFYAE